MRFAPLLHDLLLNQAKLRPQAPAVVDGATTFGYSEVAQASRSMAQTLGKHGIGRGDRVAIWLEKRIEGVHAVFACSLAGAVFVPANPLLKSAQLLHILNDCGVSLLVTTAARKALLDDILPRCPMLRHVLCVDEAFAADTKDDEPAPDAIDNDLVAIFYTSGSTGRPKGVMLSHRNLVAGAQSVAHYLGNNANDCLLAALPLSFDAGFSQITTAFSVGASVVLLNYLMPRDIINAMAHHGITGLTGVPPLWSQLAQLDWPADAALTLRYLASTGGRMPLNTLQALRARAPKAHPYLMYGLTEAFRATYLPPEEIDSRPHSIGRAIPNAEVIVLRDDGSLCDVDEPGELVQRGALVAQGYWGDSEMTARRFKPLPLRAGQVIPEIAVFSGDTVRRDADGYLYFIGRHDEMIKTSGYRLSPTEIEEACDATGLVAEAVAFGIPDTMLGQVIGVAALPAPGVSLTREILIAALRTEVPAWMLPAQLFVHDAPLPRNPNGKLDRALLTAQYSGKADAA